MTYGSSDSVAPTLAAARAASVPDADGELAARALSVARRTALGVLGDPDTAADIAQEVALQALRHRRALRDPAARTAMRCTQASSAAGSRSARR